MPAQSSCRLYTGCRSGRKQVSPELIRVLLANTLFDNVYTYFDISSTVRFRSSSLYPPDSFTAAFSPSLTTTSLKRSSMRWFEACPCRPAPGGQNSHHQHSSVGTDNSADSRGTRKRWIRAILTLRLACLFEWESLTRHGRCSEHAWNTRCSGSTALARRYAVGDLF